MCLFKSRCDVLGMFSRPIRKYKISTCCQKIIPIEIDRIGSENRKFRLLSKNFSDRTLIDFGRSRTRSLKLTVELVLGCSVGRTVRNQYFPIEFESKKFRLPSENFSDQTLTDFGRSLAKLPKSEFMFTPRSNPSTRKSGSVSKLSTC